MIFICFQDTVLRLTWSWCWKAYKNRSG